MIGEVTSVRAYLVGDTVEGSVECDAPTICVIHKRTLGGDLWIVLNESIFRCMFSAHPLAEVLRESASRRAHFLVLQSPLSMTVAYRGRLFMT